MTDERRWQAASELPTGPVMNSRFLGVEAESLLQPEVARLLRLGGLQFVRVSTVEIASMEFQPAWSVSDSGEVVGALPDRGPDSSFPAAAALVSGLAGAASEHTRVQRMSPRRWAFTWLVNETHAVVAEAHYRDKRDAISDMDTALVRLACSAGAHLGVAALKPPADVPETNVWPRVDRRARARASTMTWITLALPVLAAFLAAWLALRALPDADQAVAKQHARIEQLAKIADATMTGALATALSAGDYGELQDELTRFFQLRYFQSALVTNQNGRVVALAGAVSSVRIGDRVSTNYSAQALVHPLTLDARKQGELTLVPAAPTPTAASLGGAQALSVLAALAAAATALLLALTHFSRRRR